MVPLSVKLTCFPWLQLWSVIQDQIASLINGMLRTLVLTILLASSSNLQRNFPYILIQGTDTHCPRLHPSSHSKVSSSLFQACLVPSRSLVRTEARVFSPSHQPPLALLARSHALDSSSLIVPKKSLWTRKLLIFCWLKRCTEWTVHLQSYSNLSVHPSSLTYLQLWLPECS